MASILWKVGVWRVNLLGIPDFIYAAIRARSVISCPANAA